MGKKTSTEAFCLTETRHENSMPEAAQLKLFDCEFEADREARGTHELQIKGARYTRVAPVAGSSFR
jgi:hypothetical protein